METQVAEILELSVAGKIQIVEDICSIRGNPEELPLSEAEKRELDKRLADYEQNPDDGMGNAEKVHLAKQTERKIIVRRKAK